MINILAGAISTPNDKELIVGSVLLLISMMGISLSFGWMLSRLLTSDKNKRKQTFRRVSAVVMILLIASLVALYFNFIY
jgi:hypothetical protein